MTTRAATVDHWLIARQKLQPFFPPLEPLQSLNLRAALYRCLNELKKNGILGRESVLRKTMLDECKGEKFYEILALFSTAVLKKVLVAQHGNKSDTAVARKLATAQMLSLQNQQSLLPLAIAHKAALVDVLKRKEQQRRRFLDFERLLDTKAQDISHRIRKCKETPRAKRPAVSQKEAEAVKKQLKDNWIGNEKWLDIMLHGDDVQAEDAFLSSRFDKVWYMVETGKSMGDAATETGLLENLQKRVAEQQERLQKWKAFGEELRRDTSKPTEKTEKVSAGVKNFKFDDHLQHQLPTSKQRPDSALICQPTLRTEYQDILSAMEADLLRLAKTKPGQTSTALSRRRRSSSAAPRSPARSRKNTRSESISKPHTSPGRTAKPQLHTWKQPLEQVPVLPRPPYVPAVATPTDSEATLIGHPSSFRTVVPISHTVDPSTERQETYRPEPEPTPPASDPVSSPPPAAEQSPKLQQPPIPSSPEPSVYPSVYPSEPPIPTLDLPELDPEEALAEQIITSISNATPSPVKKPQPRMSLSLIERTRMTMARTNSFEPVPESPDLPLPQMAPPIHPSEVELDRQASLLERTRLSMVSTQKKPRMSMAAKEKKEKRKSRQSLFPVNQFDTPRTRKSFEKIEESRSIERTPKEELFSDQVDYERVFKSRPLIATSPVFSPPQAGTEDNGEDYDDEDDGDGEVTGIDLGDVDQDDDEDGFTQSWADSPSRKGGPRVVRY